jgi:hypothetical protein
MLVASATILSLCLSRREAMYSLDSRTTGTASSRLKLRK